MTTSASRPAGSDNSQRHALSLGAAVSAVLLLLSAMTFTQGSPGPQMLHPRLAVSPVVSGLVTPTTMAFLGSNDLLILEKDTGRVLRVVDGVVQATVLDLAVNAASERGLLGIALHPDFPGNSGVYLFWTCRSLAPSPDPFMPNQRVCDDANMLESATNTDTTDVLQVPLLGNRVDRFVWTGSALAFDHRLTDLLAFQNDAAPVPPDQGDESQPPRGNHDGGVILFGHDRKLYVLLGDVGRRGQLQNLPSGPTPTGLGDVVFDDQFGGPEPDDAHFTGIILRLNDDGSTPTDNPFYQAGADIGGEVGANIQQIFVYGIRNSFGMAVDPQAGHLWFQENGEDAFDEINRAIPGMNSGWIQIAGPVARLSEYKAIETTSLHHEDFPNLQQLRWPPENIADTADEALARLFMLPGATYRDPEFSWKHVLAPAAIGFVEGRGLGPQFDGDLLVGMSVPEPLGGPLFHFNLTGNRRRIAVDDPALEDRVADNTTFHDMVESETLLIGRDFGVVTDIKTAPGGNVFVVSLDQGTIYEVRRK
jgi:aldose sugar dehydrogenase